MDKASTARTWASIAAKSSSSVHQPQKPNSSSNLARQASHPVSSEHQQHRPSRQIRLPQNQQHPSYPDDALYVLTLLTDKPHHSRLTSLRKRYFPPHLNKLSAHLTLFHALPGAQLETTIIPDLKHLAQRTAPFHIRATGPFRMKKGFAIGLARNEAGYQMAQEVHRMLQASWKREEWLSEQDAQEGWGGHYTIMNKVDDESEVARAFQEVKQGWKDDIGTVEGLGLWRYERGWWKWERRFDFSAR